MSYGTKKGGKKITDNYDFLNLKSTEATDFWHFDNAHTAKYTYAIT